MTSQKSPTRPFRAIGNRMIANDEWNTPMFFNRNTWLTDANHYSMNDNLIFFTNMGLAMILAMFGMAKRLRDNQTLKTLLWITTLVGVTGSSLRFFPNMDISLLTTWSFWNPFVYITLYAGLRHAYRLCYQREPTYHKASWFDPEEGRKQNTFDVFVHLFPMLMALIFPFIMQKIFQ